jgi:hypothetical protein
LARNKNISRIIKKVYDTGRYEGEMKDGKRNGQGIFYYKGGNRYEGNWEDDNRNGQGIHYFKNYILRGGDYENKFNQHMNTIVDSANKYKSVGNITKEELNDICERQTNITECYNIANDPINLKALVGRLPNRMVQVQLESVKRTAAKMIREIEMSAANDADKLLHITNIRELTIKREKDFCRSVIRENTQELSRMRLSPDERTTLKYLDLNNNFLFLCDDISPLFKTWMRYYKTSEKNPLESFFYDGRHAGVTFIAAIHDDTIIDAKLRKNARNVIYGNPQVLISSVEHKSSGYGKQERAFAERVAPHLYRETAGVKNHRKLCYIREDPFPFRYTIAKTYPMKRFISDALWRLCDKLPQRESKAKNKYLSDQYETQEIPLLRR